MATNQTSQPVQFVHDLAEIFRSNGHRVQHGNSKVCLTSDSLITLSNFFQSAKLELNQGFSDGTIRLSPTTLETHITSMRMTTKFREDLGFLYDFLQKILLLKIINNSATIKAAVRLYPFRNIVELELKKIAPQMLIGLSTLQDRLETLTCSHSITNIQDLLIGSDGDLGQPYQWPRLKFLSLSHNFIETIDRSLKNLTALERLDLSHNRIRNCSEVLDILPKIKHLNLSSNLLRSIPIWYPKNGQPALVTLKLRQNRIETLKGIEKIKSIEELDLSDNFITIVPIEIRQLLSIKRLFFERNPCVYANNYRKDVIKNLPYPYNRQDQELVVDGRPLSEQERKMIPRTNPQSRPDSVRNSYSPMLSQAPTSNSSNSSNDTDSSQQTPTNDIPTVPRRLPSRPRESSRKRSPKVSRVESSDSDAAKPNAVPRLARIEETRKFGNQNVHEDDATDQKDKSWQGAAADESSGIPKRVTKASSKSPRRSRSPDKLDFDMQPAQVITEFVDVPTGSSEDSTIESTTPTDPNSLISFAVSPPPILDPETMIENDELTCGSIRSIFFIKRLQDNNEPSASFTIELDPIYLIEKSSDGSESIERIKYSTIELPSVNESRSKTVEFTFKRLKNERIRRVYLFDTQHDQRSFVEELNRHLGIPITIDPPVIATQNEGAQPFAPKPVDEATHSTQNSRTVAELTEDMSLDHRLHLLVVDEHFYYAEERIQHHFQCLTVRSTNGRHFLAQIILTDRGIYIYEKRAPNDNVVLEYLQAGQDLLTNVLLLDIGYQQQTVMIELQSGAFTFLPGSQERSQKIYQQFLEVLQPIMLSGEGALQKISRVSSDRYRQRLFEIIRRECRISEPSDEMIDCYSIMIQHDQNGNSQIISLLLLSHSLLMIKDVYEQIEKRQYRLPSMEKIGKRMDSQLKFNLQNLVDVTNYVNKSTFFQVNFLDESETLTFQWRLESLNQHSKDQFLDKVRHAYHHLMHNNITEKNAIF